MGISLPVVLPPYYAGHAAYDLYSLPDDRSRAAFCRLRAEEFRIQYYDGKTAMTNEILNSDSGQYGVTKKRFAAFRREPYHRQYSEATLRVLAARAWSSSALAKELVSQEQTWRAWAEHYLSMTQLDRVL